MRVVLDANKEPWFVLKDVCEVLELRTNDAKMRLDQRDTDSTGITYKDGITRNLVTVNESGLYDVIFQSRKPEAKRIRPEESISGRSWITGDNKWLQWAELAEHPSYAHLLDVIGWYVHETIPDAVRTNELLWVISCLPSTGRRPGHRRLATVSCGHLETVVVEEHRTGGKRGISVRINTETVANFVERLGARHSG